MWDERKKEKIYAFTQKRMILLVSGWFGVGFCSALILFP